MSIISQLNWKKVLLMSLKKSVGYTVDTVLLLKLHLLQTLKYINDVQYGIYLYHLLLCL